MKTLVRMSLRLDTVAFLALMICLFGVGSAASESPAAELQTVTPQEPARNLIESNEVSLETRTGTLFGTLVLPAGKPPFPVILIIAGSGMTDRDGNSLGLSGKSNCLKLLAEGLAQSGIASLRYDKRGVAKSASARAVTNSVDIQADDAARWVAWLGQSPRFRAVGIAGHSEGSFVGTLAAQRGGVRALVSLASAGRRFDEVITEQMEMAVQSKQLSQAAFASMQAAFAELRAGRPVMTRHPTFRRSYGPVSFSRGRRNALSRSFVMTRLLNSQSYRRRACRFWWCRELQISCMEQTARLDWRQQLAGSLC